MRTSETLYRAKQKAYLTAAITGIFAILLTLLSHREDTLGDRITQNIYLALTILLTLFALLFSATKDRKLQKHIEHGVYVGIATCILLQYFILLFVDSPEDLLLFDARFRELPYWIPFIYIIALLTFENHARQASLWFYAIITALSLAYVVTHYLMKFDEKVYILVRFNLINITLIVLVSAVNWFKEQNAHAHAHAAIMADLANTDYLTNTSNRRHIDAIYRSEIEAHATTSKDFSVIILDLDDFKRINDHYGHDRGDKVLQEMASLIRSHLRPSDRLGRWGGEEFIILASDADAARAFEIGERIRKLVEEHSFGIPEKLTASLGVASTPGIDLIKSADEALYRAKARGKNCVEAA
jgi:diguanylate cyclase (GGDEF)-like protein